MPPEGGRSGVRPCIRTCLAPLAPFSLVPLAPEAHLDSHSLGAALEREAMKDEASPNTLLPELATFITRFSRRLQSDSRSTVGLTSASYRILSLLDLQEYLQN